MPYTLNPSGKFDYFSRIAKYAPTGPTLPTSPITGQWFLHTPTGRSVLMQYVGGVWNPIYSFGTVTIYVDPTGTDAAEKGFATGTDAFLTINYAIDQIPPNGTDVVEINVSSGTYVETIDLTGKFQSAVTINGTMEVQDTGTATAVLNGSVATRGFITDTTKSWTVDQFKGMYIEPIAGGQKRLIYSNTADTVYTVQPMVGSVIGGTYSIYQSGTIFSTPATAHTLAGNNMNVTWWYCKFAGTPSGNNLIGSEQGAVLFLRYCSVMPDNAKAPWFFPAGSVSTFSQTYITLNGGGSLTPGHTAPLTVQGSYINNLAPGRLASGINIQDTSSLLTFNVSNTMEGFDTAITTSGPFLANATANSGYMFWVNCNTAIEINEGGVVAPSVTAGVGNKNHVFDNCSKGFFHNWTLGETTFNKKNGDMSPALIVKQKSLLSETTTQTIKGGQVSGDFFGNARFVDGVVHYDSGYTQPSNPLPGMMWYDQN